MSFICFTILRRAVCVRKVIFMKKKAISAILAASFVLGMAGCSKDDKSADETSNETVAETQAVETEAEPAETEVAETEVAETESADETLKVVSISPELTEIIFALGAQDMLVGVSAYDDYPADVFNYPVVGDLYTPDVEAIVACEPDFVLASSFLDDDTVAALDEYGINVMVVTEGTDIEGMFDLIAQVAEVLGVEEAGDDLIADTQAALESIEVVPVDATVYYVVGYGEWGDYTAGAGTFIDSIITTAGAQNAAADVEGWTIDLEALLEADPDVIIISQWMYDDFIATEPYASLTAVQEGRVISVDANIFERQTPRNVEAVEVIVDAVADYATAEA